MESFWNTLTNLSLRMSGLALAGFMVLGGPEVGADAPRVAVPSVAVTSSNSELVFSAANYNQPLISFAMGPQDKVELKVDEGVLSLAQTEGLVFEKGDGEADESMLFSGLTRSVNQALDGLVYDPPAGFAGAAQISLRVLGETTLESSWRVSVNGIIDPQAARRDLLSGVDAIHSGVQPGRMVSYGPQAYDIAYYEDRISEGPMIAAASWGAGRVVAMPDHQMLNMDNYGDISGAFYRKGLAWLAQSNALDIGIVTSSQRVADWLSSEGYTDVSVADDAELPAALEGADVFIPPWLGTSLSVEKEESIGQFIRAGGGLFIADYGVGYIWWWGLPVYNAPGNRLLREAGIGFTATNRWDTETLSVVPARTAQIDAEALLAILGGSPPATEGIAQQAAVLLSGIHDILPPDDALVARLVAALDTAFEDIMPSPASPVSDTWEKALLRWELAQLEAMPVDEVQKHRSADRVFGSVPDDAERLTSTLSIDPAISRWHSTGLYLPPGELVEVRIPEEVVNLGLRVQVSGHTDDLGHLDTWLRMPRVSRSFALDAVGIEVASPFGGALYVDVGSEPLRAPSFEITFEGVVQAPFFILGKTTDEEWLDELRKRPAPYAELVAPNLAISLPSRLIRDLEGLSDLMNFWDGAVALQDQVGMHAHLRTNAERFNVDVQISAGWLHAGYPIQGPVAAANELVDFQGLLERGSWGWLHELGHEAQRRPDKSWGWVNPYTFDGSVEVTVNIFTSYVFDQYGIPARGGWDWTGSQSEVMRQALNGLRGGESYASVGVGVKLAMFLQLRDSWGWEAFERLFQGYHDTLPAELPADEAQKRDQFLTRFCAVVGHDLSSFMGETWGLAFSREALDSVGHLPTWMPALGGIEGRFKILPAETRIFDLAGEALSHDGVARITGVSEVEEGTLEALGDGRWAYTPAPGFAGVESFDYTVVSSTGHEMVSTIELELPRQGGGNEAPTAIAQSVEVNGSVPHTIILAGTDPEGDDLSYALVSGPANGSAILTSPGSNTVTYTPSSSCNGSDRFTFRVSDGNQSSELAVVSITVSGITTYALPAGWSMISLPCAAEDPSLESIFPKAISLFEFEGGYQRAASMEMGKGYWINLAEASTASIRGGRQTSLSVALPPAWSMVGPGQNVVSASSFGEQVISVFGFEAGYFRAAALEPGKGYWVNLSSAGTLDLNGSTEAKPVAGLASQEGPRQAFLWAESAGGRQMIQLGVQPGELRALPPLPPPSLFDVRVEVEGIATWQVPRTGEGRDYRLQMQGGALQLGWQIPPQDRGLWQLVVNEKVIELAGEGRLKIEAGADEVFVRQPLVPQFYTLGQNFPNPFNPSTTIQYRLPRAGPVSLKVYDIAGQLVRHLVDRPQSAGSHQVIWDGLDASGAAAANGVYLYELKAGSYRALRKMLLLK